MNRKQIKKADNIAFIAFITIWLGIFFIVDNMEIDDKYDHVIEWVDNLFFILEFVLYAIWLLLWIFVGHLFYRGIRYLSRVIYSLFLR